MQTKCLYQDFFFPGEVLLFISEYQYIRAGFPEHTITCYNDYKIPGKDLIKLKLIEDNITNNELKTMS
ncbi:MAG: hypothetical protein SCJ97_11355, partial [Bacillota bacterium]|nr:hypothetical protein [Bacillota bacterium]